MLNEIFVQSNKVMSPLSACQTGVGGCQGDKSGAAGDEPAVISLAVMEDTETETEPSSPPAILLYR